MQLLLRSRAKIEQLNWIKYRLDKNTSSDEAFGFQKYLLTIQTWNSNQLIMSLYFLFFFFFYMKLQDSGRCFHASVPYCIWLWEYEGWICRSSLMIISWRNLCHYHHGRGGTRELLLLLFGVAPWSVIFTTIWIALLNYFSSSLCKFLMLSNEWRITRLWTECFEWYFYPPSPPSHSPTPPKKGEKTIIGWIILGKEQGQILIIKNLENNSKQLGRNKTWR